MDLHTVVQLILFALAGMSVLALTSYMVLRFVLKPSIRNERLREPTDAERLTRLEQRFLEVDDTVDQLRATREFERRLQEPAESPQD